MQNELRILQNSILFERSKNCKIIKSKMYLFKLHIIVATLLLMSIGQQIQSSGVFELEFSKLEPLEPTKKQQSNFDNSNTNSRTIEQQMSSASQTSDESPSNLIQVLVCLKEAFTSQLDGPCTFGNASLTLYKDSVLQEPSSKVSNILSQDHNLNGGNSTTVTEMTTATTNQQQQGSLLTNVVRIPFTFRWTKSFTIILTAEEIERTVDNQQQQQHQLSPQNRRSAYLATLIRPSSAINGTNLVDLSTNLRLTKDLTTTTTTTTSTISPISTSGGGMLTTRSRFIDRHVLTENEVLPNLEPNPNKPWAERFSRSLKSSIAYRFRVYCSLNYYGDGCTTFCRPRDDQFGHYNCSSTGQKVCLDGWYGSDCEKAKCRAGCNQQHGYCEKPDTCQCRPGWTGVRCDECLTYPGCANGYCLSPWQCICHRNWGGVYCDQDLNVCGTREPCKNNGTCHNVAPGKYKCSCPEGFTGVDCDLILPQQIDSGSLTQLSAGCALNPCLNGGTCYGFRTTQYLDVNQLESPFDSPEVRTNNTNESVERIYRCQCPPNWTGDYCQWADSPAFTATNVLLINGTSERINNTTDQSTIINHEVSTRISDIEPTDKVPPFFSSFIENQQQQTASQHLDMKHIISWVVIASVIGVFLASLLLAWCCLIAIEHNRFSFIQMNIIRSDGVGDQPQAVTSTLRRMHEKIRDSFRLSSRARIRPETKLSIENVLRPPKPPPPYEENDIGFRMNPKPVPLDYGKQEHEEIILRVEEEFAKSNSKKDNGLVIKGSLEQKLAPISISTAASTSTPVVATSGSNVPTNFVNNSRLRCPKHGHLYRQQQQKTITTTTNEVDLNFSDQHSPPYQAETSKYAVQQACSHFQSSNYHLNYH